MASNLVFSCVPMPVTAAMITTAIRPAIRPYSIAVAPLSSRENFRTEDLRGRLNKMIILQLWHPKAPDERGETQTSNNTSHPLSLSYDSQNGKEKRRLLLIAQPIRKKGRRPVVTGPCLLSHDAVASFGRGKRLNGYQEGCVGSIFPHDGGNLFSGPQAGGIGVRACRT